MTKTIDRISTVHTGRRQLKDMNISELSLNAKKLKIESNRGMLRQDYVNRFSCMSFKVLPMGSCFDYELVNHDMAGISLHMPLEKCL